MQTPLRSSLAPELASMFDTKVSEKDLATYKTSVAHALEGIRAEISGLTKTVEKLSTDNANEHAQLRLMIEAHAATRSESVDSEVQAIEEALTKAMNTKLQAVDLSLADSIRKECARSIKAAVAEGKFFKESETNALISVALEKLEPARNAYISKQITESYQTLSENMTRKLQEYVLTGALEVRLKEYEKQFALIEKHYRTMKATLTARDQVSDAAFNKIGTTLSNRITDAFKSFKTEIEEEFKAFKDKVDEDHKEFKDRINEQRSDTHEEIRRIAHTQPQLPPPPPQQQLVPYNTQQRALVVATHEEVTSMELEIKAIDKQQSDTNSVIHSLYKLLAEFIALYENIRADLKQQHRHTRKLIHEVGDDD